MFLPLSYIDSLHVEWIDFMIDDPFKQPTIENQQHKFAWITIHEIAISYYLIVYNKENSFSFCINTYGNSNIEKLKFELSTYFWNP